jgi:hypothetical protein
MKSIDLKQNGRKDMTTQQKPFKQIVTING